MTKIFVPDLDPTTTEAQLKEPFAAFGSVKTFTIVKDRDTGGPRGFALVEMTNAAEATAGIKSLYGCRVNDQAMRLNEVRPKLQHDLTRDSSREHRRHRI